MTGYTKLFHTILASTVWRESNVTRIVWVTLMAMSDKTGLIEGSIPGVADFARVSVSDCRAAIARLLEPDPDSRTKTDEGRRLREVDGGWRLVNHAKYRAKMGADERREYLRLKQAEHRAKRAAAVNTMSTLVNSDGDKPGQSTDPDLDPDPDQEGQEQVGGPTGYHEDPHAVLVKIAHAVLDDVDAGRLDPADLKEAFKTAAARLGLSYSANSVQIVLNAVDHQRARQTPADAALRAAEAVLRAIGDTRNTNTLDVAAFNAAVFTWVMTTWPAPAFDAWRDEVVAILWRPNWPALDSTRFGAVRSADGKTVQRYTWRARSSTT